MYGMLHRRSDDTGASAVEFALVSMVLTLFLVGIAQFGVLFTQWLEIEHAAREGARWASLIHSETSTKQVVRGAAPGVGLTDGHITVDPPNPTIFDADTPVTVTIVWDSPVFAPLFQTFMGSGGPSFRLTAAATQKIE